MPLIVLNGPVIEAGQSLSSGIDCTQGEIVRLTMPAGWTGANLSFQISSDGNGYNDLFRSDGSEVVVPCVAGVAVVLNQPSDMLRAVAFLKIRSGSRQWPVPQEARREFAVAVFKGPPSYEVEN